MLPNLVNKLLLVAVLSSFVHMLEHLNNVGVMKDSREHLVEESTVVLSLQNSCEAFESPRDLVGVLPLIQSVPHKPSLDLVANDFLRFMLAQLTSKGCQALLE